MNVPDGLRYSKDHEWVRVDGDVATVGIVEGAVDGALVGLLEGRSVVGAVVGAAVG